MYIVQYLGLSGKWAFTGRQSETKEEALLMLSKARKDYSSDTWRLIFITIEVLDD